ncbi:MAG: hypothetical protein M3O46_02850 [Myxococcota bacterium]|nr:hypothetical protein [Myxococcota bacterium]
MADTKKPPPTPQGRGAISRSNRPAAPRFADPVARIAACEAGLAKATSQIATLRLSVEAIHVELAELRATVTSGLARLRKLPPPLRASPTEVISVDEREVTLESIRPKRPR